MTLNFLNGRPWYDALKYVELENPFFLQFSHFYTFLQIASGDKIIPRSGHTAVLSMSFINNNFC